MKNKIVKSLLVGLLCINSLFFMPSSVKADEEPVKQDFTMTLGDDPNASEEGASTGNSFDINIIDKPEVQPKESNTPPQVINVEPQSEAVPVPSYTPREQLFTPTAPSQSRGTITENVGADNKPYPIRDSINDNNQNNQDNSGKKERPKSDAREFVTFKTRNGKVFHLIIDHDKSNDNAQLLTEVSEQDLLNMIVAGEKAKGNTKIFEEKKETPTPTPKAEEEPKKEKKDNTLYLIGGFILVGGGIYYVLLNKKKKKASEELEDVHDNEDQSNESETYDDFDYDDYEEDDDEMSETSEIQETSKTSDTYNTSKTYNTYDTSETQKPLDKEKVEITSYRNDEDEDYDDEDDNRYGSAFDDVD